MYDSSLHGNELPGLWREFLADNGHVRRTVSRLRQLLDSIRLRRYLSGSFICLAAVSMLFLGLGRPNFFLILCGCVILFLYYLSQRDSIAGIARLQQMRDNTRYYLLDRGLLVELLLADNGSDLLLRDHSLDLATLQVHDGPTFSSTHQRLAFLLDSYAQICADRGWRWRGRLLGSQFNSPGRRTAGLNRRSAKQQTGRMHAWERDALAAVLIDILEDRIDGESGDG